MDNNDGSEDRERRALAWQTTRWWVMLLISFMAVAFLVGIVAIATGAKGLLSSVILMLFAGLATYCVVRVLQIL